MRFLPPLALAAFLTATPALGFAPTQDRLEFPLAWEADAPLPTSFERAAEARVRAASFDEDWRVQANPRTGVAHFAIPGDLRPASSVSSETQAELLARDVLAMHAEALGTADQDLELRNVATARGKYAVHFQQEVNGVPVWNATAFVVLHESGRVMATGSGFFPHEGSAPAAVLGSQDAIAAAATSIGASPRTDREIDAQLWMVPVPGPSESFELAPAWRTTFVADEPFGLWETFVHAVTGEILSRNNGYHRVDVTGNVEGVTQDFSYCDGLTFNPMSHLQVNVSGGNSADTDENGDFVIPHGGATNVTVTAELFGNFFNVNRFSGLGADGSFSGTFTPGTPGQITLSTTDVRQDEIDTYFHSERAHTFMTGIDSDFDLIALPQPMNVVVGRTDGFCPGNAWWDPSLHSVNYCEAGGSYENTGEMGNVIYHEYGHGVSQELYIFNGSFLPSGDMHEGNSDIIANFIDRNPIIGIGFQNCSGGIRNADNNLQWPADNNGGHSGGQIIAGFFWDSWQEALAALPQPDADAAMFSAWHFGRVLGTPQNQQDQVTWTFIADDDDGDLNNGTPHHEYFQVGAENHNFAFPPVITGIFFTHERMHHTDDGSSGVEIASAIVGSNVTLDPATIELVYRVNDGPFNALLMSATGNPDEYAAMLPPLPGFAEVDYYLRASDTEGSQTTLPEGAPAALHSFDVTFEYDGGEEGPGAWTLGLPGDTAVRGQWELVDPIPTLAQPGDDSTPGSGTHAFLTGQCGPPNCSGSCVIPQENSCSDVDFGVTTLLSPVYDLSGATQAKVKYDRWFTNNTGLSPNFDHWIVDVSNDGGSSWTNVEDTTISNPAWISQEIDLTALFGTPGQVQVRFVASDTGNDSVVECAVDEFRILADAGGPTDVPSVGAPTSAPVFSLRQNQPNPFGGTTRIDYSIPTDTDVSLAIYDVSGRRLRTLESGPRPAGAHTLDWDGRDDAGRHVAAGLYFYRLRAGEKMLTRKLTLLP